MRGRQRIKAIKQKRTDVGWVLDKTEKVWSKFIPYQTVMSSGEDRLYYITFGAQCLWKTTSFGALGGVKGAWQNHPMTRYRQVIIDSCLNEYLKQNSKYWRDNLPKISKTENARKMCEK